MTVCGQLATVEVAVRMLPVIVVVTPGWRRPMKPNRRKVPESFPKPSRAPPWLRGRRGIASEVAGIGAVSKRSVRQAASAASCSVEKAAVMLGGACGDCSGNAGWRRIGAARRPASLRGLEGAAAKNGVGPWYAEVAGVCMRRCRPGFLKP